MGTTIRRQPITSSIPASPDYKFLNITNFGGIEKSSNPFVVSSNTSSDCLNVYVDEYNALTTRPRLEQKADLIKLVSDTYPALGIDGSFDVIAVYDLHDGYLLHGLQNSIVYLFKIEEKASQLQVKRITGTCPKTKCLVFEQDEKIFLLGDSSYKQISGTSISNVNGFIPTLREGSTNSLKGATIGAINLLSDRYKETYFWDGTWNVSDVVNVSNLYDYKNEYISQEISTTSYYINSNKDVFKVIKGPDESPYEEDVPLVLFKQGYNLYFGALLGGHSFDDAAITIPTISDKPGDYNELYADCTPDGSIVVARFGSGNLEKTETGRGGLYVYRDYEWQTIYKGRTETDDSYSLSGIFTNPVSVSKDGTFIATISEEDVLFVYKYNNTTKKYDTKYMIEMLGVWNANRQFSVVGVQISDSNKLYIQAKTTDGFLTPYDIPIWDKLLCIDLNSLTGTVDINDLNSAISSDGFVELALADNDTFAVSLHNGKEIRVYSDFSQDSFETIYARDFNDVVNVKSSGLIYNGNVLYTSTGYFNPLNKEFIYLADKYDSYLSYEERVFHPFVTTNQYGYLKSTNDYIMRKYDFNSSTPLLNVTFYLKKDTEEFENQQKFKNKFLTSKLKVRFDNNMWFASDNTTFYTQNNDPSYIPISSHNNLGEDYEHITGLSIVNDDVLAAYKRNRIYIINPITIGDKLTYSYTETKNVIGNDAVGAPILTILTEMPTIVSYDGVYALNQLENVQSSDRITTLISEAINPLWLKENKEDIDDCKTLNRLYWTYYILPSREKGISKIYLLDNRTQQWYYWELPIYVLDAYVKNNKTHLVTEDGLLYSLETSDLINEYNTDVTEYYDKINGKKHIIPWHWYSQILSLNTINYSKKLIDTTFVLTDTDTQDEYALDYSFKAWRKSVSETNATTINNNIHYVKSTTKRTMIPRFNFIQFRLNNTEDDLDNNKLRLVGLGLKYVLLEGLY